MFVLFEKIKNLLIPYYFINGGFLIFQTIIRRYGFEIGEIFSLKTWILSPWIHIQPSTFSIPTWYLPALFIAEIYFIIIRKIVKKTLKEDLRKEISLLLLFLIGGIAIVYILKNIEYNEVIIVFARSALMLFFMESGVIYKKYIEKLDKLSNRNYFILIGIIQAIIIILSGNDALAPGLYGIVDFWGNGIGYFITGITGIAFWLRIAKIVKEHFEVNKFVLLISKSTRSIMSFHLFGFFILNCILNKLYNWNLLQNLNIDFEPANFKSHIYYTCTSEPRLILIYFLFGMGISLIMHDFWLKIEMINNNVNFITFFNKEKLRGRK